MGGVLQSIESLLFFSKIIIGNGHEKKGAHECKMFSFFFNCDAFVFNSDPLRLQMPPYSG